MKRRNLIARVGGVVALGGLAGCLGAVVDAGSSGDDAGPSGDDAGSSGDDAGPSGDGERETPPEVDSSDDDPIERYEVGDAGDDPHVATIWNAGDGDRSLSLTVRRDDETALEKSLGVPADAYLEVAVAAGGRHELVVESGGSTTMTQLERSPADCGHAETVIVLREDGLESHSRSRTGTDCN
ncbi:hypothetical protein ACFOZ7_19265 [Natribaculum luteum]|uniref:Ig-like domain-containing protein n=1 Tax=Natribaculum luteum TaxID=1586232 RepID=A0ABD5P415_9EURY|nr:hypothetical protein [Natribaculum luteum]